MSFADSQGEVGIYVEWRGMTVRLSNDHTFSRMPLIAWAVAVLAGCSTAPAPHEEAPISAEAKTTEAKTTEAETSKAEAAEA